MDRLDYDLPHQKKVLLRNSLGLHSKQDYNILAITDHEITNDVNGCSTKDFLVLGGMELHPACPFGGACYHLVCLNVPYGLEIPKQTNANTCIEIVKQAGGEVITVHAVDADAVAAVAIPVATTLR